MNKYKWLTLIRKLEEHWKRKKAYRKHYKARKQSIKTLKRIDKNIISNNLKEIRLFAILRNESLRLPHFLEYYKQLGVERFFFVDNNSDDDSTKTLLKENNVHIFNTNETYTNHWYWMQHLLDTYGIGYWCIVVDIDELFYYPNIDLVPLPKLIQYLEKENFTSVSTLLLDMYSDRSITETTYTIGSNPLLTTPFFDIEYQKGLFSFFDWKRMKPIHVLGYIGGMRERVFGKMFPADILTKVPLFKYDSNVYLIQGMHAITGTKASDIEGVVFHTKFLQDFIGEVKEEVSRKQHYGDAIRYKHYDVKIKKNPAINFFYEKSCKFKDAKQLVELDLMKTSILFETFIQQIINI